MSGKRALVVGSGAGGAVCAFELATAGWDVTVIEEGGAFALEDYGQSAERAMALLYRHRGMTPLLGANPIAYVEGCCVGGSTEINSGFWRRTPDATLDEWATDYDLRGASAGDLEPHFVWAEAALHVGLHAGKWPTSTALFAHGATTLGWAHHEVPRIAPNCRGTNRCASGCPTGAKQGVSQSLLPRAQAAGARLLTHARVHQIHGDAPHAQRVEILRHEPGQPPQTEWLTADAVFLACGATETPALLRRSGIHHNIGDSLQIHPMLKVLAEFPSSVGGLSSVLPLVQITEFAPDISLGGSYLTPGHAAVLLADNWPQGRDVMTRLDRVAAYYVAVRGRGHGSVRPATADATRSTLRYAMAPQDVELLTQGLRHLARVLFAAGALAVHTGVTSMPTLTSAQHAERALHAPLRADSLNLSTVHAFASCPIGERQAKTAANSFGKLWGWQNLILADASCLPSSPGVNPQATVMALARRNVRAWISDHAATR